MSLSPQSYAYAEEIRSWLLGRLERRRHKGPIPGGRGQVLSERALLWWIFEGKRYPWLDGALSSAWPIVEHHARILLETYNPVWRVVDLPEGETDWLATLMTSLVSDRPLFVSRASQAGLNAPERAALLGWLKWIESEWNDYVTAVGPPEGVPETLPWVSVSEPPGEIDEQMLRRWAHTARRSRWPLMRNVVAESLRCTFEEQLVDRLPLPSNHATLFELLCMVRVLRYLEPDPDHIRWLDLDAGRNRVKVGGMQYSYQHPLARHEMLATHEFDHGLREAVVRHGVRVPMFADGWLAFDEPVAGFSGVLLEAKSGSQSIDAAIHQLKCYRAALKLRVKGRILVWGIAEHSADPNLTNTFPEVGSEIQKAGTEDVWVFSDADRIPDVLESVGISAIVGSADEAA